MVLRQGRRARSAGTLLGAVATGTVAVGAILVLPANAASGSTAAWRCPGTPTPTESGTPTPSVSPDGSGSGTPQTTDTPSQGTGTPSPAGGTASAGSAPAASATPCVTPSPSFKSASPPVADSSAPPSASASATPSPVRATPTAKPSTARTTAAPPPPAAPTTDPGGTYQYADTPPGNTAVRYPHGSISRAQMLLRAQRWIAEQVPYSEVSWKVDAGGTYRQDCSGYVSMAWALDPRVDFWTGNLNTVSHVISGAALQPGDILLSASHTVLFAGWADAAHDSFDFYEESRPGTNARFVVDAPLNAYLGDGFAAFRYDGAIDTPGSQLPPNPATGLDWASLEAGGSELVPTGADTAQPPAASWQATALPSGSLTAGAASVGRIRPVAATLEQARLPLPFVAAGSGAVFLVGGAVVSRRGPGLVPSRPRRRH